MLHTRAHIVWLAGRLPKFLGIAILNGVATFAILICAAAFFLARLEEGRSPALIIAGFVLWVLAVPSVYAIMLITKWLRLRYVITDRHIFSPTGLARRHTDSIPLTQITNLAYRQGALDQLFGSGDLLIQPSDQADTIVLRRLPHIKKTHSEVLALLPHQVSQPPT